VSQAFDGAPADFGARILERFDEMIERRQPDLGGGGKVTESDVTEESFLFGARLPPETLERLGGVPTDTAMRILQSNDHGIDGLDVPDLAQGCDSRLTDFGLRIAQCLDEGWESAVFAEASERADSALPDVGVRILDGLDQGCH
jgi:hypothetical protein